MEDPTDRKSAARLPGRTALPSDTMPSVNDATSMAEEIAVTIGA